ncbi:MAG: hypothetical protein ACJBCI_07155 [Candidatus Tisiphia sp.]
MNLIDVIDPIKVIDSSLNNELFNKTTGYVQPEWSKLIQRTGMYKFK